MLSQAKSSPDITNYLAYIFSNRQLPTEFDFRAEDMQIIRSSAAINLKNSVKTAYRTIPEANQSYIRASVLHCLEDPNSQIRNFAGNVITEIVQRGGILGWPELLPQLLSLAGNDRGNTSPEAQEGAMGALAKVCEDSKKPLDKDYQGQRPLDVIIPKLLNISSSPIARVRAYALASINSFIPQKPQALMVSLDTLLARLFQLANDPSDDVRRNVCRSFVQLVDVRADKVLPHMGGLVDYMVVQQRNTEDPGLALEAAEFWLCIGENDELCASLGPYLHKIVPVLLESMVYSEEDVLRLEGGADDANEEDKAEDLKPHFAKSKSARAATNGQDHSVGINGGGGKSYDLAAMHEDDDLSEGEIEEDDDDNADPEDRWSLRKCSAAALDVLASVFHEPVFAITLPYLKENLRHSDWPNREAAVLALGAVADGCLDAVTPHLPDLVPYLISMLSDPEPVVRQITCWSLGRYSAWASHLKDPNDKAQYFVPMMEGILNRMLDNNKRVQEAAASAFANLEEKATKELTPYCKFIIPQFVRCFAKYKDKNMFILYDCVQTLAEHVGPGLQHQELIELLMPAIIQRWNKVSDQSRELFPLLECLSFVATALSQDFAPFAGPIFTRCVRIIHQNLEEYLVAVNNQGIDKPDKDFLVTSLDLLSAVIQALEGQSGELVATTQPRFFDLLMFCMEDPSNDVRQSSYALLGDSAIHIFPHLQPLLPSLMPVLIQQLDLDSIPDEELDTGFSVINNACWSCGEIAINQLQGMAPYVEELYQRLLIILCNAESPPSVNENAAIALGRLGVGCSQELATHLAEFAKPFLQIMEPIDNTDEKGQAFLGFNCTVERNPQAMGDCLLDYFKAIAAYDKRAIREESVYTSFQRVLAGYKALIPDFDAFVSQLPAKDQQTLRANYIL
ncbi:MAG: hypothetical protein LQ347_000282 [Umbilicaria vellea]|nr:MAG: hypothetical protein LQ347_000282 [Umbilicaria vellea]